MQLYLCEKPSQARDIARVLDARNRMNNATVTITWCFGHLLSMAAPEDYDPALKHWRAEHLPFIPPAWRLVIRPEVRKQFRIIEKLLKQADAVVIATDADREGETIAREILEQCRWRGQVQRLWLSALDEASIHKALAALRPGDSTFPLYQAGLARARADWLVGINMTRACALMNRRHKGVLSVGRVQTRRPCVWWWNATGRSPVSRPAPGGGWMLACMRRVGPFWHSGSRIVRTVTTKAAVSENLPPVRPQHACNRPEPRW